MMMKGLFAFALLSLAACTSDLESASAPSAPVGTTPSVAAPAPLKDADRARDNGEDFVAAARPSAPAAFVCRKGAFCEDFEEQSFARRWSDTVTTSGGKIDLGTDSASAGKGALRIFAHDDTSSAFLFASKNDVAGDWSGMLGFAFRLDQVPAKVLGGPELTVKTIDGPVTIRIAVRPEGVVLEQLAEASCRRDRCVPTSTIIAPAKANHWYRIKLGAEVNPRQAPPYGRLEVQVDGGELLGADLMVPFFDSSVFLRAGITQGDARRAFMDLDDVTLLVR